MRAPPQNKRKDSTRFMRVMLVLLPLGFVPLVVFTLIADYPNYASSTILGLLGNLVRVELGRYWPQVLQGVGLYFGFVSAYRSIAYLGHQREQADQMHSVAPKSLQPRSDAAAMVLPLQIWMRHSIRMQRRVLIGMVITFPSLALLVTLMLFVGTDAYVFFGGTSLLVFLISSLLLSPLAALNWLWSDLIGRTRYEITEQGITISRFVRTQHASWQDARFFAVRTMRVSSTSPVQLYFRLDGADGQQVTWGPLDKRMYRVFTSQQRPLTNAQFNAEVIPQINALVAARTGLVLIDQRVDASVELPLATS